MAKSPGAKPGQTLPVEISRLLKIPRLGDPSVSETWSLAKIVRKVEFKLLQLKAKS
jgi:hypothetical protein